MNEMIVTGGKSPILRADVLERILEFERVAKEIKAKEDELKAGILAEMQAAGIWKVDMPELVITYVGETERDTLDAKALKEELPEIYDSFVKTSTVKPSVRIKVRGAA